MDALPWRCNANSKLRLLSWCRVLGFSPDVHARLLIAVGLEYCVLHAMSA